MGWRVAFWVRGFNSGAVTTSSSTAVPAARSKGSVVILHKANASPDADLALVVAGELRQRGHGVALDRREATGLVWARELDRDLEGADLVVVLVSAASAQSEMLAYELELATQVAQRRGGFPRLLPVRVFYKGPVSEEIGAVIRPVEFEWDAERERHVSHLVVWNSAAEDRELVDRVERRLEAVLTERGVRAEPSGGAVRRVPLLEPVGGAVPLDSGFYVARGTDGVFLEAVRRQDSLVLVKGARQMGKTSLLARGLAEARSLGRMVVMTDFQQLVPEDFVTAEAFYRGVTALIAERLGIPFPDGLRWGYNPGLAFERFWTETILGRATQPVVWAIDEFDRVFAASFGGDVAARLRSWHNARALEPALPWGRMTVALAFATEAHLFIRDLNQSPFNVGTRLVLEDFGAAEVAQLNERYGHPLRDPAELGRLAALVGGQPYLLRCAMNAMTSSGRGMEVVEELADTESSVFGEHLRRLLHSVAHDPLVLEAARQFLLRDTKPQGAVFYRLRSAGVLVGDTPEDCRMRCALYEGFLRRKLS